MLERSLRNTRFICDRDEIRSEKLPIAGAARGHCGLGTGNEVLLMSETGIRTAKPSRLAAPPNFSQFVDGKPATAQRGFAQMDFVACDFQIGSEPDRATHD